MYELVDAMLQCIYVAGSLTQAPPYGGWADLVVTGCAKPLSVLRYQGLVAWQEFWGSGVLRPDAFAPCLELHGPVFQYLAPVYAWSTRPYIYI